MHLQAASGEKDFWICWTLRAAGNWTAAHLQGRNVGLKTAGRGVAGQANGETARLKLTGHL